MEFRAATQNRSVRGNWRGSAAGQHGRTAGDLARELHADRGDRTARSSRKIQLERGSALPTHFQCRVVEAESRDQYDTGTGGIGALLSIAIARVEISSKYTEIWIEGQASGFDGVARELRCGV